MTTSSKGFNVFLIAGIVLCLVQIWLPGHYLSCDGPCHLYNARIVHDMWTDTNTAIYSRFYDLMYTTDPNSMTTFLLAILLYITKGAIAEQLFLSIYAIVFLSGFWALLRRISNGNRYWMLTCFIFVFTYALSKGFYNFSFGIALYFWVVWSWLRFMDKWSVLNAAMFFLFAGLCFFTHLLPFVIAVMTCGALTLSYAFAVQPEGDLPPVKNFFLRNCVVLAALTLPFVLMALLFTRGEGGLQLNLAPHPYRLLELAEFKYIINVVDGERAWATIAGLVFLGLCLLIPLRAFPGFSIHKYDGFLLALLPVVLVYTLFPEDFMGRAIIISIRMQLFVFIIIACCIAYRLPNGKVKNIGGIAIFCCFVILSGYRVACRQEASAALDEYLSASGYIPPGSVVLPFDFAPTGKNEKGELIAKRNALFHHAADYMAVDQPLIMLDNYEANMGYFPVRWKPEMNPFNHLSAEAGIEGLPPFAHIAAYEQKTGTRIDFILFWGYDTSYLADARFSELYAEIGSLYDIVYTSPGARTVLYARKPR